MKIKLLSQISLSTLVIMIITKIFLVAAIYFSPWLIVPISDVSATELVKLTNDYRIKNDLPPLAVNARLVQAAVNKAKDMLSQGYFDHSSPQGKKFSQWIKEVGYQYFYVGENLAIDYDTAAEIFNAWINSPSHRENILRPQFQEIGIAALRGKFKNRPTLAVVQLFGTRINATETDIVGAILPAAATSNSPASAGWLTFNGLLLIESADYWLNYLLIISAILWLAAWIPARKQTRV